MAAKSAMLRTDRVILPAVSRSAALLVGIVVFVVFAGLYALSWIAAFAFLAVWLAATVLYRRRHRP
jgi:type IV secretory pathway TrbD component